ncbi:MAG: SpoIIE family protein phosphatase [Magnetococcales bacterium]|nr:SpoIIE family protein phosphatase [Magnetococcales bacterium]NGZ25291.1 SpoIIE family protein phosphatase [Magnetococcales bacterium]
MNKPTILAVDDTPENLDVIKGILVPTYRVKSALNGKTAIQIAQATPPNLILLDIMMPEMDGLEVCRQLKASDTTKEIPIIFVTAMDDEQDELHGFALGGVDYVRKPLSPLILQARVGAHIALQQARHELRIKNELLLQERETVENIVIKMRKDAYFDTSHLRFSIEPLEKTNGDVLFSACRADGGQHILLGDFTGHGLSAAIGGPLAAAFFYSRTRDGMNAEVILQEINDVLQKQLPANMFMAAAMVEVSPERDCFRYWNAGLPDLIFFPGDNREPRHLISQYLPLGIRNALPLTTGEWIPWHEQSRLYLYSDGLIEARNEHKEMFGYPRLLELLRQIFLEGSSLDQVVKMIRDYGNGPERLDDMTIAELRR